MGFVNVLRLGPQAGILICDEETWHLRMRRNFFSDPVTFLVSPESARRNGLDALYAGVGTPGFQAELGRRTAARLQKLETCRQSVCNLKEVGNLLVDEMNNLTREWRDRQLRLRFGFTVADFRRGFYLRPDGKKVEIASEKVKTAVNQLLESDKLAGQHRHNHGILMGYDQDGFNAFTVKGELGVLSQLSAGWDALGTGRYNAFTVMSRYLNHVTLKNRRNGLERLPAVIQAIRAAIDTMDHVNESGGSLQILILDRETGVRIQLTQHRSRLAVETVRMLDAGLVESKDAAGILDALLYTKKSTESLELIWRQKLKNPLRAQLLLRGWKFDAELEEIIQQADPGRRPTGKRSRGKGTRK